MKKDSRHSHVIDTLSKILSEKIQPEDKITGLIKFLSDTENMGFDLYVVDEDAEIAFLASSYPEEESVPRLLRKKDFPEVFLGKENSRIICLFSHNKILEAVLIARDNIEQDDWKKLGKIILSLLSDLLKYTGVYSAAKNLLSSYKELTQDNRQELLQLVAGSFSHVLNQPLTSILGYLDLLEKGGDDKSKYLSKIRDEAERLNDLLRGMIGLDIGAVEEYVGSARILSMPISGGVDLNKNLDSLKKLSNLILLMSKIDDEEELTDTFIEHISDLLNARGAILAISEEKDGSSFLYSWGDINEDSLYIKDILKKFGNYQVEHGVFYDFDSKAIIIPLQTKKFSIGFIILFFDKYAGLKKLAAMDERMLLAAVNYFSSLIFNMYLMDESEHWRVYLENVIENSGALIFSLDDELRIDIYNKSMEYLLGYRREEVVGEKIGILLKDTVALERFEEAVRKAKEEGPLFNFEAMLQKKDGDLVPVAFNITAVSEIGGGGSDLIVVGHDLTEIRSLEQQIIQSEKLAYFGKMSAAFVHELNNPLTLITVYTEYLLRRAEAVGLEKDGIEKLRKVLNSAERIQKFTHDFTSFARPASLEHLEEVNIEEVVKEALEFTEHKIKGASININLDIDKALPKVWAVKSQLLQVFVNLIVNAVQAIRRDGTITIRALSSDGNNIKIEVEDNGEGIEPMFLSRIFDPFFSTKSREEGTGLGLSIVKRIIDNHLGNITVRSVRGEGTCFTISLPVTLLRDKLEGAGGIRHGR